MMSKMNHTLQGWLGFQLLILSLLGCTSDPPTSDGMVSKESNTGQVLYVRYCADCHGWEGAGNGPVADMMDLPPPSLRSPKLYEQYTPDQVVDWVLEGREIPVGINQTAIVETEAKIFSLIKYMRRLPAIDWREVRLGQEIYDNLCISCHGLYGRGDGYFSRNLATLPRDLADPNFLPNVSQARLLRAITYGKGVMPGTINVLDDPQRQAVLSFVDLFSTGFETYERYCMVCHGAEGIPVELAYSDESMFDFDLRALPSFNAHYFAANTDEQLSPKVLHMLKVSESRMPHFAGTLNAAQVREIVAYLKNLGPES